MGTGDGGREKELKRESNRKMEIELFPIGRETRIGGSRMREKGTKKN